MTRNNSITIVGAGIGGLTTALALKKSGYQVDLYESAPEIKPVGAGIAMANNAMQVFDYLGVREQIEQAGHKISDIQITDAQLRTISSSNLNKYEKQYGVHNVAIHRADLQRILAENLGSEHIHLSKRLYQIDHQGGFNLQFEDGTSVQTDVLIGADGIRSKVREQLFPKATIRDTHQRCWRGVTKLEGSSLFEHRAIEAWYKGRRFGFVKLYGDTVYWYAVVNDHLIKDNLPLIELFHGFHQDVLKIIDTTTEENIYYSDIMDLQPISLWTQDKVCLIGDAAHATTPNMGQGACQAVEDAYILGQLLGQGKSIEQAFIQYQHLRLKKAHFIVNTSWTLGKVAHFENSLLCWIRNRLLKTMPKSVNERQLNKVFNINYSFDERAQHT